MIELSLADTPDAWTFNRLRDALWLLGVEPRRVLHVGAHHGEEVSTYWACGFRQVTLVEPDPTSAEVIRRLHPEVALIEQACAPLPVARVVFTRAVETVFSGLRPDPARQHDAIFDVPAVPVSSIQYDTNVLVVDTQGTELDVLRSADLGPLDLVILETQAVSPDGHAGYWPDVLDYLTRHNWVPAIQWRHEPEGTDNESYADTLFVPSGGPR